MGSKGGGGGTTTVQKSDPWIGVQPYLVGSQARQLKPGVQPIYAQGGLGGLGGFGGGWGTGNTLANPESDYITVNSPGIYPEAQNLYQANGWSPQMQTNADDYADTLQQRMGQENIPYGFATNAMSGRYDPSITAGGNVDPQMVDPTLAFGSMGMANPTNSISQMLSGQANTDTLDPVVAAALRRMGESYGEQVMPSIRSGAIAAGQYGGSRQGVAEGLASKGLAYSMGDTAANMYNNA